jgi:YidC/Oxa1 family membrane protein insertase
VIQQVFLGIDLTQPSVLLGAIAGVAQFVLMRFFTTMPTAQPGANDDTQQMMMTMQKNMMYIFPVMTVFIAFQLPAALAVYWVATTIFAIGQQYFIKRTLNVTTNMPVM